MTDWAHNPADAHAATVFAGAARILDQAVALHHEGIFRLDRLYRQVGGVGDMDLHAILAVLGEAAAEATAQRFQIEVCAVMARVMAKEHRRHVGAVGSPHRLLGQGLGQGANQHVDHPLRGIGPARDRRRMHRVNQGAQRGADLNCADQAMVIRQIGIQHRLQDVVHCRLCGVEGHVEVTLHLRPGTGEVKGDVFAVHIDTHRNGNVRGTHAIVVQQVGKLVPTIGHGADAVTQARLGPIHDGIE